MLLILNRHEQDAHSSFSRPGFDGDFHEQPFITDADRLHECRPKLKLEPTEIPKKIVQLYQDMSDAWGTIGSVGVLPFLLKHVNVKTDIVVAYTCTHLNSENI